MIEETEVSSAPRVRVIRDSDPENPRKMFEHAGHMVCAHRRYNLGDEQVNTALSREDLPPHIIALPLYLLDHSGLSLSTRDFGDPWDSGQVGWIYMTREAVVKVWGWKRITAKRREALHRCLLSEVEEYDQYLRGDVWGFVVEGGNGDSCFGFYGDDALEGMRGSLPVELHPALEEGWANRWEVK
jgi:hypothetical protein